MKRLTAVTLFFASACASSPVTPIRFENRPVVWEVDDRRHVQEVPEASTYERAHNFFDTIIAKPVDRVLAAQPKRPPENVNALGEVPDSTWYENRALTPEQVLLGPGEGQDVPTPPFTITSAKQGGKSVGYIVKDKNGVGFILKFDDPDYPELKTTANIVAQRLFYALGYHVPEDHVGYFQDEDLVIGEDVKVKLLGVEHPLTRDLLAEQLENVYRDAAGIRGLFSRMVDGEILGGWLTDGRRDDDPADVIDHEHRREVRALHMFFAWLEHTDAKEDNRLDVYVTEDGRSYVKHFLVDFDKTLGANAVMHPRAVDGFAYAIDFGLLVRTLPTFGLWTRPWEKIELTRGLRGVGRFQSKIFYPDDWVPRFPETAFVERTKYDDFWAATVLARIGPEHIEAAVRAANYTDPDAAAYVAKVLEERRQKLLHYGFSRVSPIAKFELSAATDRFDLCFRDFWVSDVKPTPTRYRARVYAESGRLVDEAWRGGEEDGRICMRSLADGGSNYQIVRMVLDRDHTRSEPVEVHLGRKPDGSLRIVGVVREGEYD